MPLPFTVEKLDTIPEAQRSLYVKAEGEAGGFRLDLEGYEDPTALKTALKSEREAAKLSKQFAKLFPDKTPDEIAEMVKKSEEGGKGGKGKGGAGGDDEMQRLIAKREKELKDEYDPIVSERDKLKQEMETLQLDGVRRAAALKAGVFPDEVDDALALSRKYFELGEGKKVVVLDEDGDPTSMSVEKFYASFFKQKKPRMYQGSGASGSGAGPSARPGADGAPTTSVGKIEAGMRQRGIIA